VSTPAEPITAPPDAAGDYRYPGALPFGDTALDRLRFFGRDDEAHLLLHKLLSSELLVLFAKPGLGKTSLLNTRIRALLGERDFLPLPVRFNHLDTSLTPLNVVTAAIKEACETAQIKYRPGSGESLWEFLKTAGFWRQERLQTPVLVLDQFEEIFMLQEENFRHETAAELGELIAHRLPNRIVRRMQKGKKLPFSDKPPEVKVLISLREDDLGMLQELTPQIPAILQTRFRLTGLSAEAAYGAIVKPAALKSGEFQFATHPFTYSQEAIDQMISAAQTKEGIDPFFLQILCSHVEKLIQQRQAGKIASDDLVEVNGGYLGGAQSITTVAKGFYRNAVNLIPDRAVRERVKRLCEEGLLTPSGNRRSLLKEDVEANFGVERPSLDVLENIRLLRKESKHGSFYYEISHDRLAEAIYEKRVPRDRRAREGTERMMDSLIFKLRDRLPIGKSLDLLAEVQTEVETQYERMAEADESVEMQHRRACAHETKGDIVFTRGDLEGALESYRKRHHIAEKLAAQDPANIQWQRDLSVSYEKIGDVQMAQGDPAGALSSYQKSLAIRQQLAADDPSNSQWRQDLSASHEKIGNLRMAQGDPTTALSSYQKSLAIRQQLAVDDPTNSQWPHDLSVSYEKIGDLQLGQGDPTTALTSYQKSLEIRQQLAARDPTNSQWPHDLSVSHEKIGDVRIAQGDPTTALGTYRRSLAIREQLATDDPADAQRQRDLSVSYIKIGDAQRAGRDLHMAFSSYKRSLQIAERLAASDPANTQWQRDLLVNYAKIGDLQRIQGDRPNALNYYQKSLKIGEQLAARDSKNTQLQRDLSVRYDKIGDVQKRDSSAALSSYQKSLEIRKQLAAHDSADTQCQRDLSVSYENIGDLQRRDSSTALSSYNKCLAIREQLAARDPANAQWQRDLSVSYEKIGDIQMAQGDSPTALSSYQRCVAIREQLAARDPANAQWQRDLSGGYEKIGILQSVKGDLDSAFTSYKNSFRAATQAIHAPRVQSLELLTETMATVQSTLQSGEKIFSSFYARMRQDMIELLRIFPGVG
jgi:tetratricopeptide (TPR) repeat protein